MCKQPVITTSGEIWGVWDDVPTPPSPSVPPDFAHHDGDKVLHRPGAKLHHAQALHVCGEQPASPYPARVRSNIGQWSSYQLAQNAQVQVHLGWRTWRAWLPRHPDRAVQFSSSVTFGHAIQHSLFWAIGQMNVSTTRQPLKCDREMHCLHFSKAADGWWQEHAQLSLWSSLSTSGLRSAQTFRFPKLLVRIRWTFAGKIQISIAVAVHAILRVRSRTDFTCSMWRSCRYLGSTAWGIACPFRPFLMAFNPAANSYVRRIMCP